MPLTFGGLASLAGGLAPQPWRIDRGLCVQAGEKGAAPRAQTIGHGDEKGYGPAVTPTVVGTSSTQVVPGWRVIGLPVAAENRVG